MAYLEELKSLNNKISGLVKDMENITEDSRAYYVKEYQAQIQQFQQQTAQMDDSERALLRQVENNFKRMTSVDEFSLDNIDDNQEAYVASSTSIPKTVTKKEVEPQSPDFLLELSTLLNRAIDKCPNDKAAFTKLVTEVKKSFLDFNKIENPTDKDKEKLSTRMASSLNTAKSSVDGLGRKIVNFFTNLINSWLKKIEAPKVSPEVEQWLKIKRKTNEIKDTLISNKEELASREQQQLDKNQDDSPKVTPSISNS